jgi:hypothetical protein
MKQAALQMRSSVEAAAIGVRLATDERTAALLPDEKSEAQSRSGAERRKFTPAV